MATYNGGRYIEQQLDSLINQTYTNWELIIRDDGSTDDTLKIVKSYLKVHSKISLIINETALKGSVSNFSTLYSLAKSRTAVGHLMFCDQDDIWLVNKMEETMHLMQDVEKQQPHKPVMIYGNLQMITADGEMINEEMNLMKELRFNRTLAQNYAFGCTIMINTNFIRVMESIPASAENHDYWICLVATAFAECRYLEKKLLLYRQHGNNATSQGAGLKKRFARFTTGFADQIKTLTLRVKMFQRFLDFYRHDLDPDKLDVITDYLENLRRDRFSLIRAIFRNKIYKLGWLQNVGMIYTILFFYGKINTEESKQIV
ncbi:glycosyltransferase family 2 protein [Mucilaginibacter myungsuensis]|uniref:Glycosyltransferase family 2 protein n=1 Tax=Mucilaginibacter myungsuensis TaxID=649104 RepID=A0A929PY24_9SPHI|nr:glycosyltransferase family 2 protein [Mucilaginibacter myungsuensis]MBE9663739.1 glycosyltransferase family 2 protein [Mucilaginibacter myungsuensis]MDN3598937.1 glycosyltransferase family 2 protein [Mucilaginibacter myungsuensis]